jgi:hypothetical protein
MGRPKGSKNKSKAELDDPTKKVVSPIIPSKNTMDDDNQPPHPLDDIHNVQLETKDLNAPTEYDRRLITELSSHQLTAVEICAVLDISRSSYDASLAMQQAYQRGQEMGKASLRRRQWLMSHTNVAMAIFLGKQYLGQKDVIETQKDDGGRDEARQAFEDKLKSIIDVTPKGSADGAADPRGSGSSELLLETVGERQPVSSDERPMVEPRIYPKID